MKSPTEAQRQAEEFENDFDSPNPSPTIQFNYSWAPGPKKRRKSRRNLVLQPTNNKYSKALEKRKQQNKKRAPLKEKQTFLQQIPLHEVVVDAETRVYRTPNSGWDGMVRRVVQYKYAMLDMPKQFNRFGKEVWSGPDGVIQYIQNWAGTSGWRNKKVIREVMNECLKAAQNKEKYDAGQRVKMQRPRKRKMNQDDANLAGLMLRTGAGVKWSATMINHKIINGSHGRSSSNVICRNTVANTLKGKYDAKVHRRQKKGTGSRDKTSIWATARNAFTRQLYYQLGMFHMLLVH